MTAPARPPPMRRATPAPADGAGLTALGRPPLLARAGPLLVLALATLYVALMYRRVFAGELAGDDNTFHWAEAVRIADGLRHGDLDLWNPSANAGFPTGYYYQLLPAAVPGALAAVFGHTLFWFQLAIFLPLVLVPAAGYRALRVLDIDPWPALGGGVAIAVTLSNSKWGHGADGVFAVGLFTQVSAFAAFPLALAHGLVWLRRGTNLASAIGWGVFVGVSHPVAGMALGAALAPIACTTALAQVLASVSWWPYPAPQPGAPAWRPLVRVVVLGAGLLIASAAAWAPTLIDYQAFGGFPHRLPDEAGPGFAKLARWLASGKFLDEGRRQILTALVPLGLIVGALLDRRAHALRAFLVAALVFAFVIGIGKTLKSQDDLFPAVRFMGALQIVLAMGVGAGAIGLAQRVIRWADRLRDGVYLQGAMGALVGVVLVGLAPTFATQHDRVRISTDWDTVYRDELRTIIPAIAAARPGRLQNRGPENHWAMMLPYIEVDRPTLVAYGGAALQSSPNFVYLWATPSPVRAAWIYDAPLVLTTPERGPDIGGTLLAHTAHFELRELAAPGLVAPVQVTGELPAGRAAMRKAVLHWQDTDAAMHSQVLAHHGHGIAGPPPDGDARAIVRGRSRIDADLDARAATTFAIRESWHPRWRATLDGRPARVRRISPDMMAVDVVPGMHHLTLRFVRPWWTWASWSLWPLAMILAAWWSRRRAP
ncbi:MAG: hypothetical protein IPL61_09010 [Myxococcales bacterium]|nr:hypothetical protein [Myxococcales bacterium]